MFRVVLAFLLTGLFASCAQSPTRTWHLMLAHDQEGTVEQGATSRVAAAVRDGCQLRIAWGARRKADPTQTVEHVADALWVTVRNGNQVQAQVEGFMANLSVLGEPQAEHPRFERFGGTQNVVMWRAILSSDGNFDAIWYGANDGQLKFRAPQRHPMRWYSDCVPDQAAVLYPMG